MQLPYTPPLICGIHVNESCCCGVLQHMLMSDVVAGYCSALQCDTLVRESMQLHAIDVHSAADSFGAHVNESRCCSLLQCFVVCCSLAH